MQELLNKIINDENIIITNEPAQKWLKDRVGQILTKADTKHYNKIINALMKTDEISHEIDKNIS